MIDPDDAHDFLITMLQVIPTLLLAQFLLENVGSRRVKKAEHALAMVYEASPSYENAKDKEAALNHLGHRLASAYDDIVAARRNESLTERLLLTSLAAALIGFGLATVGAVGVLDPVRVTPYVVFIVFVQLSLLTNWAVIDLTASRRRGASSKRFLLGFEIAIYLAGAIPLFLVIVFGQSASAPPPPTAPPATTTPLPAPPTD